MNVNKTNGGFNLSDEEVAKMIKDCDAWDIAWFKLTKEERVKLDKEQTAENLRLWEREEA